MITQVTRDPSSCCSSLEYIQPTHSVQRETRLPHPHHSWRESHLLHRSLMSGLHINRIPQIWLLSPTFTKTFPCAPPVVFSVSCSLYQPSSVFRGAAFPPLLFQIATKTTYHQISFLHQNFCMVQLYYKHFLLHETLLHQIYEVWWSLFSNPVEAMFVSNHSLEITIGSCSVLWSYR